MKRVFLSIVFIIALSGFAVSQITSSGIKGSILSADKKPLVKASIEAILTSTGEKYTTLTQTNGTYSLPNMKTGGPYTITFTYTGFTAFAVNDIQLNLGNFFTQNAVLLPNNTLKNN